MLLPRAVCALTASLAAAVTAAAAGLTLSVGGLGAGSASVTRCQSPGFALDAVVGASGFVESVVVGGIEPSCEGTGVVVTVTLTDVDGVEVGAGSVTGVTGQGVMVPLSQQPARTTVTDAHVTLVGP